MPFPCTCSVSPWGSNQVMVQSTSLKVRLQEASWLCHWWVVWLWASYPTSLGFSIPTYQGGLWYCVCPTWLWWVEVGLRHNCYLKVSWVLFWCIFLSPGAVLGFLGRDLKFLKDFQQNTFPSLLFLFILLKNSFLFINRTKKHQWKTLLHSKAFPPWVLPFLFSQRLGSPPHLKTISEGKFPDKKENKWIIRSCSSL